MGECDTVEFQLWMEDEAASDEELQAMTRVVAAELEEHQAAQVVPVAKFSEGEPGRVPKGMSFGEILNVEINLDNIAAFGKWLYGRLVGTSTKARFKYGEAEFEFDGRNPQELAAAMDDFQRFVTAIEAAKR